MPLQLSWQSSGLKIHVSLVRFRPEAPNMRMQLIWQSATLPRWRQRVRASSSAPYTRRQLSWIECLATNQKVRGSSPFRRAIRSSTTLVVLFFILCQSYKFRLFNILADIETCFYTCNILLNCCRNFIKMISCFCIFDTFEEALLCYFNKFFIFFCNFA